MYKKLLTPQIVCVRVCVRVCVYNYAVILCKMQRYRQLSNAGIIVGGIHIHITIVDMEMIM